jgi:UrcA family protein
MIKIGMAALAAATIALATAASATDDNQDRREAVTLRVSAQDVDFANPEAVARFRREVERQIAEACNPGDRINADMKPDFKCRREMAANLEPTVTHLAMQATQRERAFVGVE